MFGITPLTPAYGRDYKNRAQVRQDLDASKDFLAANGQYINKPQLLGLGLRRVEIRSADLRRLWIVPITEDA